MNQAGIVTGTGYERFSFRANIESKINKYLTIGMNMAPTYIVQDGSGQAMVRIPRYIRLCMLHRYRNRG